MSRLAISRSVKRMFRSLVSLEGKNLVRCMVGIVDKRGLVTIAFPPPTGYRGGSSGQGCRRELKDLSGDVLATLKAIMVEIHTRQRIPIWSLCDLVLRLD